MRGPVEAGMLKVCKRYDRIERRGSRHWGLKDSVAAGVLWVSFVGGLQSNLEFAG